MRPPITHELKIWPEYYAQVSARIKPSELRKADRDYQPGDRIILREWDPDAQAYTGESGRARVTTVIHGAPGMLPGYVALGIFFEGRSFASPVEPEYDPYDLA